MSRMRPHFAVDESHARRRRRQAGLTLPEVMIALTIFLVVMIATYMIFERAQEAYKISEATSSQQQDVRLTFSKMVETVRAAGLNINPLGDRQLTDEWIEGAWESAIFVRGDFDRSREAALEGTGAGEHSVITTGNDEIVGYVLRKTGVATTIDVKLDLSAPRNQAFNSASPPAAINEETKSITVAATTVAGQTSPPYDLYKITFDDDGNVVQELQATNIFQLELRYYDADGTRITTLPGGVDGASNAGRDSRKEIRSIEIILNGMSERPFLNYTDPATYTPAAAATAAASHRKFRLSGRVVTLNVGKKGSDHGRVPPVVLTPPTTLSVCDGHCRTLVVSWTPAEGIDDYIVKVTPSSGPAPTPTPISGLSYALIPVDDASLSYTIEVFSYDSVTNTLSPTAPAVTIPPSPPLFHDTVNNIPAAVSGMSTAPTGGYGLEVSWATVENNIAAISTPTCYTSEGGTESLTSPLDQQLIDIDTYEVHRVIDDGINVPDFTVSAATRIDNAGPVPLNFSPGANNTFTDRRAAPCQGYFYKVRAVDKCGLAGGASSPMGASVSYTPTPADDPPSAPGSLTSSGPTIDGTNYVIPLVWSEVTSTVGGSEVSVAHYHVRREKKVGLGSFVLDDTFDVYETTTMTDTVPITESAEALTYRYQVFAQFDCAFPLLGGGSPEYVYPCSTSGTAEFGIPAANEVFTRAAEEITNISVNVTGSSTPWTSVRVIITEDATGVKVYDQTVAGSIISGTFTLPAWSNADRDDGTYTLSGQAYQGICSANLTPRQIELDTTVCNVAKIAQTNNSASKKVQIRFRNDCTDLVRISAITPFWSGGESGVRLKLIKVVSMSSPTDSTVAGKLAFDGLVGSGTKAVFNKDSEVTPTRLSAAQEVVFELEFDKEIKKSGITTMTFPSSWTIHTDAGDFTFTMDPL
ncbi:MAG TPA: prepilin-type N-terminal cleavage/methylation domain-containing protein [Thermoanaerobaculia bacterium]|nr:prepilin-type N-terminal cleavage/methylation domain-containing protein [Thermoanaerobaculia bacterium]